MIESNKFLKIPEIFFYCSYSTLYVNDIILRNLNNIFPKNFFCSDFSDLFIENLEMRNISLNFDFVFLLNNNSNNNNIHIGKVNMIDLKAKRILQFISVLNNINNFTLQSAQFRKIDSNTNLMDLNNVANCFFENVVFSNNVVIANILISSTIILWLKNVTCFENNKRNEYNNTQYGSCFIILNNFQTAIENLKIIKCYSFSTALFVINNFIDQGIVRFQNSIFVSNNINIKLSNDNMGGVLKLDLNCILSLSNSIFVGNKLEMENDIFAKGPCINVVSKNSIFIAGSYFKENRSSKVSNCIYSVGSLMNITRCSFFNNSISFISEEIYDLLNQTRSFGENYNLGESKGGAIFFAGMTLIINFTNFEKNKANYGSAIYVNENLNNKELIAIIKIENCFFNLNHALFSSLISLNFFNSFQAFFSKCIISNNLAYNGGVMLIEVKSESRLNFFLNYFSKNSASFGPVILVGYGPAIITSHENVYYQNGPKAFFILAGGVAYVIGTSAGIVYLENEKYFENSCYHGVLQFSGGKGFEFNGTYMRNTGLFYAGVGLINNAAYVGKYIRFFDNFAAKFGCVSSLDSSDVRIEDSIFKNCSSNYRGACILIQMHSNIVIENCIFLKNYLNTMNVIELQFLENVAIFKNISFFENTASLKMIEVIYSKLILENAYFLSNKGNLLAINQQSRGEIINAFFKNITTQQNIIDVDQQSFLKLSSNSYSSLFVNGSLIFCEDSNMQLENLIIKNLIKINRGAIIYTSFSEIYLENIQLFNVGYNFFYLNVCKFFGFNVSYYWNKSEEIEISINGVFFFLDSELTTVSNFTFFGSEKSSSGGFFSLIDVKYMNMENCYFSRGRANNDGGVLFIENSNLNIVNNFFRNNTAKRGSAIFFNSSKCKFISIDLNYF